MAFVRLHNASPGGTRCSSSSPQSIGQGAGHTFYGKLKVVLAGACFDSCVDERCTAFYKES